jgi:large subunit ribosomal protein L25
MQHSALAATLRTERGRSTSVLREAGQSPAVMYGFGTEPMNITVDRNAFLKAYAAAGTSTVVDLSIEGTVHSVMITEVQRNPVTDFVTHVDFRRIDMSQKIEAKIPLVLIGESMAVKGLGGTLIQSLEEVEVLSLPNALVHEIEVDISGLKTFDDVIRVSDIVVPAGIEVKSEGDVAVASVQPPRSDAELAALNEAVDTDISKIEVLKEKKVEDAPAEKK